MDLDNPTSGFAFAAVAPRIAEFSSEDEQPNRTTITVDDLMFLLDDTYQLWCAGSMNPFERIIHALNIRVRAASSGRLDTYVTSEDAAAFLGSLASRLAGGQSVVVSDPTIDVPYEDEEEDNEDNEEEDNEEEEEEVGFGSRRQRTPHPDNLSALVATLNREDGEKDEDEDEDVYADGNVRASQEAVDRRFLSDMFARSMHDTTVGTTDGCRSQTCLLTSDVVLNAFRRFIFCVNRLRQAFVIVYDGQQPTAFHNGYDIAAKFKAILARLQDLQNLYALTCATARESCSTIGYKEFMQLPNLFSLLPHLFHFERSNTLLDAEYRYNMERMISSQVVNAPPHADMGLMDEGEVAPPAQGRACYHEPVPSKTAEFNDMMRTPLCAFEVKERYIIEVKEGLPATVDLLGTEGGSPLNEQEQSDLAQFESGDADHASVSGGGGGGGGGGGDDGGGRKRKRQSSASISRQVFDAQSVVNRRKKALFQHILFLFSHHGLVQHPEKRTILAPMFNSKGIFTRAYHDLRTARGEPMTIEAMVYCLFNTLVNTIMFHIADPTGMCLPSVVKAFSQINDPQFPIHSPNRCIISFDDGLLCVPTCRFYPYSQLASSISPAFLKSLYHVAGNMRSVAGGEYIRSQLQQEQQMLMQAASCCYVPRPMGAAFSNLMKKLHLQIEVDVLDVLYPIRSKRDCSRLRSPTPSSPDKVFHLYVDLLTVKFREFIEQNPTIYDTTFLWQIGIDTRRQIPSTSAPGKLVPNPNFMRRLANPVSNSAARKLEQMIQQDLQASSLALARQTAAANAAANASAAAGNPLPPPPPEEDVGGEAEVESSSTSNSIRSAIRQAISDARERIMSVASRLTEEDDRGIGSTVQLSDALEQLVDRMDEVKRVCTNDTTGTRIVPPTLRTTTVETVDANADRHGDADDTDTYLERILESVDANDKDAMRAALSPAMEAFTKHCNESPEHQAYRALLMVFMILGTYFVPRDKHLGYDLPIALWLRGIAGSGKTKALDSIIRSIYGDARMAIINNNIEKEFGFAPLLESSYYVGIAHDFQGAAFPFDIYQQLVTDGKMRVPRKNVDSYEVNVNLKPCFCCNRLPRWPNQGATKDSPGAFTRRSLVFPFMCPLHESLSDADYEQRVQEESPRIVLMLALTRKYLVPTFSVKTFWERSSRVVNMWRLDAEATLMPFDKFVHELGIFEFNAMAIIADVDMRVLLERFKANYRDYGSFSYEELTTYLMSHPDVFETGEETFSYYRFNAVKPCRLKTKYIIGLRYTFSSVQMFGSASAASSNLPGAEKYSPHHNLITEAEHPSNQQRFEADVTGTRRRSRPTIPTTTTTTTTTAVAAGSRRGRQHVPPRPAPPRPLVPSRPRPRRSMFVAGSQADVTTTNTTLRDDDDEEDDDEDIDGPSSEMASFIDDGEVEEEEEEEEEERDGDDDGANDSPVTARDRRLGLL